MFVASIFYYIFADVVPKQFMGRFMALFRMVGAIERMHDERYGALIRQLEKGTLYRKMQPVQWICPVCGRVHEGTEPPEYCPVCGQPRGAFRPI